MFGPEGYSGAIANCMMMGAREADESLWSYQAKLWHWNDRHANDDEQEAVEPPSVEWMAHRDALLAGKGYKVH